MITCGVGAVIDPARIVAFEAFGRARADHARYRSSGIVARRDGCRRPGPSP
jgi:hypothetical protein